MDTSLPALELPPVIASRRTFSGHRITLAILLVIYILNFLDRQIVNILAEPIKHDLHLSDAQLGMMTGLGFALFYTILGLPIARLAERGNRVWIIGAALSLWSLFTMACGVTRGFAQLLACRVGVGVGEAGCSPASHSLISDVVPAEKRASALAIYSAGIPLGSMAGLALGGLAADALGWRGALMLAGIPGLLMAVVLLLTVRDPRTAGAAPQTEAAPSIGETWRELKAKRAFWWAALGAGFTAFVSYGHTAFLGSFFLRAHAGEVANLSARIGTALGVPLHSAGFVGTVLGLIIGIAGLGGTWVGGVVCDRWALRDRRAPALVSALAGGLLAPAAILVFVVHDAGLALALLILPVFLQSVWYGPIFALAQSLVSPRSRATAAAVLLFLLNVIGLGFGPLLVGMTSDRLAPALGSGDGLRWAMALAALMGLPAALCFLMAARTVARELAPFAGAKSRDIE